MREEYVKNNHRLLSWKIKHHWGCVIRHFKQKINLCRAFSFCDDTVLSKCNELKKEKISSKEKLKTLLFFHDFVKKIKVLLGCYKRSTFIRWAKRSENVNQFYERFELVLDKCWKKMKKILELKTFQLN